MTETVVEVIESGTYLVEHTVIELVDSIVETIEIERGFCVVLLAKQVHRANRV